MMTQKGQFVIRSKNGAEPAYAPKLVQIRVKVDFWNRASSFYRAALNAGRSSPEKGVRLSVCLSVCLSNAWIVTKRKEHLSRFCI